MRNSSKTVELLATDNSIAIIGLGYVGVSTALCFSSRGFSVIGVDVDREKLTGLRKGRSPFSEDRVTELLSEAREKHTIEFTDDFELAVRKSDTIFITVGTPSTRNGSIDIAQVKSAARSVRRALGGHDGRNKLLVVKSTVVPGTTNGVVRPTLNGGGGGRTNLGLAVNPEFLREGSAIADTLSPDRIVIGADDGESGERLVALYRRFYGERMPEVLMTNVVNAEMIKYASNSFLATKVSFINDIANMCEKIPGADVKVVSRGMGLDGRIGRRFLDAGLGYGGSCFPKDVRALLAVADRSGTELRVIRAAHQTNALQPLVAIALARSLVGSLRGKRVALLGVAFKPGTRDVRDAVSLKLVRELRKRGAEVVVFDPEALSNAKKILGGAVAYAKSIEACIRGADCCIIVTEWDSFRRLLPEDFSKMRTKALVDGRRILDPNLFLNKMKFAAVGYGKSSR